VISKKKLKQTVVKQVVTTRDGGDEIPSKYAKLGVKIGWDPTPANRLRLWVTGIAGHGKSTFAYGNDDAIVFDTEDTGGDIITAKARRIHHTSMDAYLKVIDMLVEDGKKGTPPCKHVVFDTFDKFIELAIDHLTDEHNKGNTRNPVDSILEYGQQGAGWARLREFVGSILGDLYGAGYGWTVVGHVQTKKSFVDGKVRWETRPVMAPSITAVVFRESQIMAHVTRIMRTKRIETGIKTIKMKSGKTREQTQVENRPVPDVYLELLPNPDGSGINDNVKARYMEYLPQRVKLPADGGWSAFVESYEEAIEAAREDVLGAS